MLFCSVASAEKSMYLTVPDVECKTCSHLVHIRYSDKVTDDMLAGFENLVVSKSPDERNMNADRRTRPLKNEPSIAISVVEEDGNFLWSVPSGWYPSDTIGLLTRTPPSPKDVSRLYDYEVHWWGISLWLDRTEACSLSTAGAALFAVFMGLTVVCPPCALVSFACGAQAMWLGLNTGKYGAYVEVSWLGFLFWAEPIGPELTAQDDCFDANPHLESESSGLSSEHYHDPSAAHGVVHTPLGTQVIHAKGL
jgi:hypothetical protein